MTLIKRDFFAADPSMAQVRWNDKLGGYYRRIKSETGWEDSKLTQPFAIDVWRAMYGYEYWDNGRTTDLVPVDQEMPEKEGKGKEIYSLIIFSPEIKYKHELVVQGQAATAALADLFDNISGIKDTEMPVVKVDAVEDKDRLVPDFSVVELTTRPAGFGKALINIT